VGEIVQFVVPLYFCERNSEREIKSGIWTSRAIKLKYLQGCCKIESSGVPCFFAE